MSIGKHYNDQGHNGYCNKKRLTQQILATGKKTKGCTGIGHINQIKKTGYNSKLFVESKACHNPELGQLVDNYHNDSYPGRN
jgi:hypothetical protein